MVVVVEHGQLIVTDLLITLIELVNTYIDMDISPFTVTNSCKTTFQNKKSQVYMYLPPPTQFLLRHLQTNKNCKRQSH